MIEKREFHRIELSAKATICHQNSNYEGILGSISLGGAAVTFNGSAMIPQGDDCVVSVVFDEGQPPMELNARIVNSSIYRVGVAFTNMVEDKKNRLTGQLMKLSHCPEAVSNESALFISLSR